MKPGDPLLKADLSTFLVSGAVVVFSMAYWWVFRSDSGGRLKSLRKDFKEFPILSKKIVSGNVERPVMFLTLGVSTQALPTGAHVKIRAEIDGEEVVRPYTPTKFDDNQCELMFRVYPKGKLTQHLYNSLEVGDMVTMKGPTGIHRYGLQGPGSFSRGRRTWTGIKYIAMVAGGTGVTPMLQIANCVTNNPDDGSRLAILLFNSTMDDVMMQERLDQLAGASEQVSMSFFVGSAEEEELAEQQGGLISSTMSISSIRRCTQEELVKGIFDALGLDGEEEKSQVMVCMCGPDGFVKKAKLLLKDQFQNILVW